MRILMMILKIKHIHPNQTDYKSFNKSVKVLNNSAEEPIIE